MCYWACLNIYGVFIVKGECRALRAENSRVVRRGAEGRADAPWTHQCVLLDLGTGIPSDSSPVTVPRHPRSLQNSKVCCVVYRGLWEAQKEQTTQARARSRQEAGPLPSPVQPPCSQVLSPAQTALWRPSAQGPKVSHLF